MTTTKCRLKLSKVSEVCDTLISKEFLVLISLMEEGLKKDDLGLRVSDIHALLGGNKSWVSNLCSRLRIAGLASSERMGREVYYKLTENGTSVAEKAYQLILSIIEIELDETTYELSENTYLLYKGTKRLPDEIKEEEIVQEVLISSRSIPDEIKEEEIVQEVLITEENLEVKKIRYPIYTHKGTLLLNKSEKYLFFTGYDKRNKILILEIPLKSVQNIQLSFDEESKYSKLTKILDRPKPLILSYEDPESGDLDKIYLYIHYQPIGRSSQNSRWEKLLHAEISTLKSSKGSSSEIESDKEVISPLENVGE